VLDPPDDDKARDKHVEPKRGVLSDAGSIPAASTQHRAARGAESSGKHETPNTHPRRITRPCSRRAFAQQLSHECPSVGFTWITACECANPGSGTGAPPAGQRCWGARARRRYSCTLPPSWSPVASRSRCLEEEGICARRSGDGWPKTRSSLARRTALLSRSRASRGRLAGTDRLRPPPILRGTRCPATAAVRAARRSRSKTGRPRSRPARRRTRALPSRWDGPSPRSTSSSYPTSRCRRRCRCCGRPKISAPASNGSDRPYGVVVAKLQRPSRFCVSP
jgi:hypothetical protein